MIAALFVATNGVYYGLPDVDPWDKTRDARNYKGPHAVVAHPPCERWGKYWHGGPNSDKFPRDRQTKGADGGCFATALVSVRRFGGVLEHPADSSAWDEFGLRAPYRAGGWWIADLFDGWTCHVEQGHYGHRARKATWLYACGVSALPVLKWGKSSATAKLDDGFHSAEDRRRNYTGPGVERLSHRERLSTPVAFRDVMLDIARAAGKREAA